VQYEKYADDEKSTPSKVSSRIARSSTKSVGWPAIGIVVGPSKVGSDVAGGATAAATSFAAVTRRSVRQPPAGQVRRLVLGILAFQVSAFESDV